MQLKTTFQRLYSNVFIFQFGHRECPLDRRTADRVDIRDPEGNVVRTLHPVPIADESPETGRPIDDYEDDGDDDWTLNGVNYESWYDDIDVDEFDSGRVYSSDFDFYFNIDSS